MEIKVMDVVYQGARNPSACKKRVETSFAEGARNPAQPGNKLASPKAINYIKHCNKIIIKTKIKIKIKILKNIYIGSGGGVYPP